MPVYRLDKDDAEFLDDLWSRTDHRKTVSERRDQLFGMLKACDTRKHKDQPRVKRILWWASQEGVQNRYYKVEHGPKVAYVLPNNRTGVMPRRYAHRPVNAKTGEMNGFLQAVMIELTWEQFFIDLRRIKERWLSLGKNIEVLDEIAKMKTLHPETKTPREACIMAGIDPDILLNFGT